MRVVSKEGKKVRSGEAGVGQNLHFNNSDKGMQNLFFNRSVTTPGELSLLDKSAPVIPPLDEDDFSNNVLNIGFIAEDSNMLLSDSASVKSDSFSISAISAIRENLKVPPTCSSTLDEELASISGMEEWSESENFAFAKKSYKRSKPETIEEEEDELGYGCSKKKMGDR